MKMSSKFTCRYCKEQFDQPKGLYKHLQSTHSAGSSADNRTCPICGVLCAKYEGYRDHLLYIHGQSNEGQKLTFKSLNEFLLWKTELEIKYRCKYVLQSAPKVLSSKEKKYFYQCDASVSKSKDKKHPSVAMKQCPSVISVVEGTGVFKVEYWDNHTGHAPAPKISVENELEAAISSVEMVNAIDVSDDSLDKSEDIVAISVGPVAGGKKATNKTLFMKKQSLSDSHRSPATHSIPKPRAGEGTPKTSTPIKKKYSNSLCSLASVACGKGITKKPASDKLKPSSFEGPVTLSSTTVKCLAPTYTSAKSYAGDSQAKVAISKSSPKKGGSEPMAIAPKVTPVQGSSVSSIIGMNNAYPNQVIIVNPVGVDSSQNAGQNYIFQLPAGSSIIPSSTAPKPDTLLAGKPATLVSGGGKSGKSSTIVSKGLGLTNGISVHKSSAGPVSLAPGMKSSSALINSLPVGSTFMSVNNNLIPIASPTGAFIPSSLPPNIILTPVVSTVSGSQPNSLATTVSSQIVQNQVCFSVSSSLPSAPAVSGRKEPTYSSISLKDISQAGGSSPLTMGPESCWISKKMRKETKMPVPSRKSPMSASLIEPILNKFASTGELSITAKPLPRTPPTRAKKRVAQSPSVVRPVVKSNVPAYKKPEFTVTPVPNKRPGGTMSSPVPSKKQSYAVCPPSKKPVGAAPKFSIPTQHLNNSGNGTLLFESSGEVFMLEPIDNSEVQSLTASAKSTVVQKQKIDRSVQTFDNLSSAVPRLRRKRAATDDDDSVMMKIKFYQLEMKYLNAQTECKQLKLELTKEKFKMAELTGEKMDQNNEVPDDKSRNSASEIMKEIEEKFSVNKQTHIYTMTKTSMLRDLYEDLEDLCLENNELVKELENYRAHDKFYTSLKKKLLDEDFES